MNLRGFPGSVAQALLRFTAQRDDIPEEFAEPFYNEMRRQQVGAAKVVALLGALLVPLFSLTGIDYLFAPNRYLEFLIIRIGISAVCFFLFWLAGRKRMEPFANEISVAVFWTCGWPIAYMIHALGYETPYYAGLNLVYLATIVVPWGVGGTLVSCLVVYAAYLIPIPLLNSIQSLDIKLFINNNQFQIFTIVVAATYNRFKYYNNRESILSRLTIAKQARLLKERDRYKAEFISNITHELKTPLSIIIGNTDILLERISSGTLDSAAIEMHIRPVQLAALQLANHVDRVLAVSLSDDPEAKLDTDNYNYLAVVESVFSLFESKAHEEGIDYNLTVPDSPLVVRMDVTSIEEVLSNLIQNAFKYTERGGKITVCVGADGEKVYTEVSDTGVGIPAAKLESIFDRMFQADDTLSRRHGGIGLGLYITKRNVELHGGDITVQSRERVGTSFRFTLPLHIDQTVPVKNAPYKGADRRQSDRRTRPDRRAEERRRRFEYQQSMSIDDLATMNGNENNDAYEGQRPSAPSVLIVEDNQGMMKVMIEALRDEYNLILAKDGGAALEKLQEHSTRISLILSDIMMPGMSGFDFCAKVMEHENWRHIPVIFVTALMSVEEQLRGYEVGATDYIVKPYNVRILKEKVHHWISRRRYELLLHEMSASFEARAHMVSQVKDIILHEVRNPLQIIMGADFFIRRIASGADTIDDTHELREYLETLRTGVNSLNAVLETSQSIELSSLNRRAETLASVVSDALEQTAHLRDHITTHVDLEALADVAIMCEHRMLVQVLVNIVRNATEAIDAAGDRRDGHIHINHLVNEDQYVLLTISDNGTGIDLPTQEKLFRFKFTTKKNGTGVGLHLSKMILKLHEGAIGVESTPGAGAVFTLTLPKAERFSRYTLPPIERGTDSVSN